MNFEKIIQLITESEQQTKFAFYDDESVRKLSPTLKNGSFSSTSIQDMYNEWLSYDEFGTEDDIFRYIKDYLPDYFEEYKDTNNDVYCRHLADLFFDKVTENFVDFRWNDDYWFGTINDKPYFWDREDEEFVAIDKDDILMDPEGYIERNFPKFDMEHLESHVGEITGGKYYHYTTEENWENIQEDGYLRGSGGTGLYNRGQSGIFTSTNPDEYSDGIYGEVCLEIDADSYVKDGHKLYGEVEDPIKEYYMLSFIYAALEIEEEVESESDYSFDTIILQPEDVGIPIKYIKICGN